jgi:hypothetical protein
VEALEYLKKIQESGKNISVCKEAISELLFNEISNCDNQDNKNRLLKVRRKIYNLKNIKMQELDILKNKEIIKKYKVLIKEIENRQNLLIKYKEKFNYEILKIREHFKTCMKLEDFQKGLLISSDALFKTQEIYQKSNEVSLNRKQEQIERGLLRYYSRMALKATPFGTFCSIIPGELTADDAGIMKEKSFLNLTSDPIDKSSLIIINKGLYGSIITHLTKKKEIKRNLPVELNQTIVKENSKLIYLTSQQEKEIFQHLDNNEVLELFIEKLEDYGSVLFNDLIKLVCSFEELEATEEEAEAYIDKLIEIGFLRFKFNIPEQLVDWVTPLVELLNGIEETDAKKIKDLLVNLNGKISEYVDADVKAREALLKDMDEEIKQTFEELEIESQLRADLPFYEDATSDSKLIINKEYLDSSFDLLIKFIEVTKKAAYPRTDSISMRHFYDDFYKDNTKEIPLLKFYEDYYREHYKEHLEKQRKVQAKQQEDDLKDYDVTNPFKLDVIKKIQNASRNLRKVIIEKWLQDDQKDIVVSIKEIEECYKDVPGIIETSNSASIFSQVIASSYDGQKERLFIPAGKYLLGYGKYFSRFLRLFSQELQDNLYNKNNSMSGELIAEISGDANFNANLHPPLVKHEISYPTSEVGLAEKQIKCDDLLVVPDPGDPFTLRLKQKSSGKFVLPLDLGFLNPMMRPPLFQLMAKFTPPTNYSLPIPEYPIVEKKGNDAEKDDEQKNDELKKEENKEENLKENQRIIFRPRVILEDKIVLSRKSWIIPKPLFPEIERNENLPDYFIRITNWREENNIPGEVYVKIKPMPVQQPPKNKEAAEDKKKEEAKTVAEEIKTGKEEAKVEQAGTEKNNAADKSENKEISQKEKEEKKAKQRPKQSRDYFKPQYINFLNPLYVNLFGKLTVNLPNFTATLEERYPGKDQLLVYDNNYFANEQIFQINFPEKYNSKLKSVVECTDAENRQ